MKLLAIVLLGALLSAAPDAGYHVDLTRYFRSPSAETAQRVRLSADVAAYARVAPAPRDAAELLRRVRSFDALLTAIRRHDIYLSVRSAENVDDAAAAKADDAVGALEDTLRTALERTVVSVGASRLRAMLRSPAPPSRYAYLLESALAESHHALGRDAARAADLIARPALDVATSSYAALRRSALACVSPAPGSAPDGRERFTARFAPFAAHEDAFAALLDMIATERNGLARLHGYRDATDAAYAAQSLSADAVARTLAAVRASPANRAYQEVVVAEAARNRGVAPGDIHVWDLAAADRFEPPAFAFPNAVARILDAETPMGPTYATAFVQLFDPASRRVELCTAPACDDTGFSAGFAGVPSVLFYGKFDGSINAVRAVAHEAGHAVHRELMREHQPIAAYQTGPKFMFESFAIFNELLLYDRLARTAASDAERAYYLRLFLDDATFQVFGSAAETDLEARMYARVATASPPTAAELDDLTLQVFAGYDPLLAREPAAARYWARDRLYFTDPLYDVNYLFAGLLALAYVTQYERDASRFSPRYTALLENGFSAPPAALVRGFLAVDLNDEAGLVRNADELIARRTTELARLYAGAPR